MTYDWLLDVSSHRLSSVCVRGERTPLSLCYRSLWTRILFLQPHSALITSAKSCFQIQFALGARPSVHTFKGTQFIPCHADLAASHQIHVHAWHAFTLLQQLPKCNILAPAVKSKVQSLVFNLSQIWLRF